MLKRILFAAGVAFVFTGCCSIDYTGDEFPETNYVKLFFDKRFVSSKIYQQIGTATLTVQEGISSSEIDQDLIEKGKKVGADAVLITNSQTVNEGPLEGSGENTSVSPVVPEANVMGIQPDGASDETNSFGEVDTSSRVATYEYETVITAVFYKKKRAIHKIQQEDKLRAEGLEVDKKKVYVNKAEQAELARKYKAEHTTEPDSDKKTSKTPDDKENKAAKSRELTSIQTQEELNKTSQMDKKIINNKDKDKLIVDALKSQETSTKAPSESQDQTAFDKQFNPDDKNDPLYDKYKKTLNQGPAQADLPVKTVKKEEKEEKANAKNESVPLEKLNIKPPQDKDIDKILDEIKKENKKEQEGDGKESLDDDSIK
jgi:hypothetical protein